MSRLSSCPIYIAIGNLRVNSFLYNRRRAKRKEGKKTFSRQGGQVDGGGGGRGRLSPLIVESLLNRIIAPVMNCKFHCTLSESLGLLRIAAGRSCINWQTKIRRVTPHQKTTAVFALSITLSIKRIDFAGCPHFSDVCELWCLLYQLVVHYVINVSHF